MKNEKKTTWVFIFQKYGKFWSILLGRFINHKAHYFWRVQHKPLTQEVFGKLEQILGKHKDQKIQFAESLKKSPNAFALKAAIE